MCGPATVETERATGHRVRVLGAQEERQGGNLLRLYEPFDRGGCEHDLLQDLTFADAVGERLVNDLSLQEGCAHIRGLMQLDVTPCGAPSRAATFDRPSRRCLADT